MFKFIVFFSCLVAMGASYYTAPQQCGQNEVLSCVNECPETTCKTRDIQYRCQEPTKICEKKCVCKHGYYRNYLGNCITGKQCDQCNGSNEFFSCGQECDNECSSLSTQNRTNCPIINIVCNSQCYCEDGFARNNKSECIPVENCPKSTKICKGQNEKYVNCKRTCPPELCVSVVSRYDCTKEPPCQPGCACKSGFYRIKQDSPCVGICNCKEMKTSLECLKKKNIY